MMAAPSMEKINPQIPKLETVLADFKRCQCELSKGKERLEALSNQVKCYEAEIAKVRNYSASCIKLKQIYEKKYKETSYKLHKYVLIKEHKQLQTNYFSYVKEEIQGKISDYEICLQKDFHTTLQNENANMKILSDNLQSNRDQLSTEIEEQLQKYYNIINEFKDVNTTVYDNFSQKTLEVPD